ncbi:hypothetical protein ACI01nite_09590 [Acetobacter cibinongensis]|uniref:DUF2252 domain-containing protein n=1 Tax=Acetobacter cibinongensis TaxID=146475 RepID=A0A0D6N2B3_9PROT|nr:DUF2252 domain-containing protein [Acetobacter cibinongensis]GAN60147.1 hypothetical protein Abci_010_012 [Acetobacter cibinongensis]GBQ17901.1 hypothetical protein AA0482_2061 [Acetobacter cibinongensis NRIC 0482]GEL58357.1 hypothetical protein ACI01nite_09590 [Acetobacter cibinongensis]
MPAQNTTPYPTRKQSTQLGAARRKAVPRAAHATWDVPKHRADPVALLATQGLSRIQALLPVRYDRMKVSPFTFLRGAAVVMASDLASTPTSGIRVQSCGDCHLANFGSYASPEGVPVFDINDFDETLDAPFEWDIKRLGTSLVLAGLEGGFSNKAAHQMAESMTLAYCRQITQLSALSPLQIWASKIDLTAALANFKNTKVRSQTEKLLAQRLESAKTHFGLVAEDQTTPRFKEKPPLIMRIPEQESAVRTAFARYVATQPPERAILLQHYRLQDVIFKVVGIGSVGTFCAIGLFTTADGEPLLLQIKEAQPSVLAPAAGPSPFANQGERVVTGQRIMQAVSDTFLGWTHTSAANTADTPDLTGSGRQFYVRRLKDSRLAAVGSDVAQDGLPDYATLCGITLARAHARSGNTSLIAGYVGKGPAFAKAIAEFSVAYAAQTHTDWQAFTAALQHGALRNAEHTTP